MGRIVGGERSTAEWCTYCTTYSFAPLRDEDQAVVRECRCGLRWQLGLAPAAEIDAEAKAGRWLPANHWGDENRGGLAEVAQYVVENVTWEVVAFVGGGSWKFARERLRRKPYRSLTSEDAVRAARHRVAKAAPAFSFDEVAATEVRTMPDGAKEVDVIAFEFRWTVQVRVRDQDLVTAIVREPAWVPKPPGQVGR